MSEIVEDWYRGLLSQPTLEFRSTAKAVGNRSDHLGPRLDSASIALRFEPASTLVVGIEIPMTKDEAKEFATAAIHGALDVLVTFARSPILKVAITVTDIEIDDVNSNARAFRMAGRDAATKILLDSGFRPWSMANES